MTTATLPVAVMGTGTSITAVTFAIASTSLGLAAASGQYDVVLLTLLIVMDTVRGIVSFTSVPQQHPQFQMPC